MHEGFEFFRHRFGVDAVQGEDSFFDEVVGDAAVGGYHRFFNGEVGDVAVFFAGFDFSLVVDATVFFGFFEKHAAVVGAPLPEFFRHLCQCRQRRGGLGFHGGGGGFVVEAVGGFHDSAVETVAEDEAVFNAHFADHAETVLAGFE